MATLLYIHGFNSSPQSQKAQQTHAWLAAEHPEIAFRCPFLSAYPDVAMAQLEAELAALPDPVYLMGSSMGGFYATWLAAQRGARAVLINPAVRPWLGRDYLLGPQANHHTGEIAVIEPRHLDALRAWEVDPLPRPQDLLVLLQTGDEVLDYRQAEDKYRACRLVIEAGGDHGFQHFERHFAAIHAFFTAANR